MVSTVEQRLADMGIEIVAPAAPVACYRLSVRTGDLVHLSGHGPVAPNGTAICGVLGRDLTIERGYEAARRAGINMLNTLYAELGSLDKIMHVVKLFGVVQSAPDFHDHPKVVNGCSELFRDIFGEHGVGARSAVGTNSLSFGWAVEIDGIFLVES